MFCSVMSFRLFEEKHHAKLYSECRPTCPQALLKRMVEYVLEKRPSCSRVVDVGCGSGQFTRLLAEEFEHVLAVDVSEAQISFANKTKTHQNIDYRVSPAETLPVQDSSMDLVTAIEAVHWFNIERFLVEVDRVLCPGGCVFLVGYRMMRPRSDDSLTNEQLQKTMEEFESMLQSNGCWTERRKFIKNQYTDIVLPYEEKSRDDSFDISLQTTMTDYVAYLRSVSACQTYIRKHAGQDATVPLQEKLMEILGSNKPPEETKVKASSPLFCVFGRKS